MKRSNHFVSAVVVLAAALFCGCSNPRAVTGADPNLTAAGEIVLRAAIRHGVSDYIEAHGAGAAIRAKSLIDDLLLVVNSDASTTLGALKELAYSKIPAEFSPIEQQDARDVIDLVALAIQNRIGDGALNGQAIVDLRDVLGSIAYVAGRYVPPG